ncbi:MAG: DinB family protein [candidate division Zixibacteria bacterium]|nr:DinB family protein [candidate division Zixibacteria bacterium]
MTRDERTAHINSYANAHTMLVYALKEMPKEAWQYKPTPKEWSIHEIIVHLTDADLNSSVRMRTFIAQPGHTIMAYEQDEWTKKLEYHKQSMEDSLEAFKYIRKLNGQILKSLPDSVWSNTIQHPESGTMSFEKWLKIYDEHTVTHIGQMKRNVEKWKASK